MGHDPMRVLFALLALLCLSFVEASADGSWCAYYGSAMEGPTAASIRSSSAWRHFPETALLPAKSILQQPKGYPRPGVSAALLGLSLVDDWIRLKSADS